MSTLATAPEGAGQTVPAPADGTGLRRPPIDVLIGLMVAVALVALAFLSSGSVDQTVTGPGTWSEIAITVLGAAACAAALLLRVPGRAWGATSVALFAAFTGFAGLSILWSVQPDWSWFGANQLLAYLAMFAGAAALARTFPERWPALVGGVAMAMVVLSAYSLLAKVFPDTLAPANTYGRLQAPFGYWNALGVTAAMGLPACLWAASRRGRGLVLRGLSVPAMTLLITVVVLSYSRSAALAAVVGIGCWIGFVPLRLRAALMLGLASLGAAPILAWALAHHGLTGDNVPMAVQDSAGHTFGLVLLVVVMVMVIVGVCAAVAADRVAVSTVLRRRIGTGLVVLVALVPVAAVIAMAASHRGLTGEISHAWSSLTSSKASVGDTSARLTQLGSSRPLYWRQGLDVGAHALFKGAGELGYGVARLRHTTSSAKADQAHSYLVQTFADLGLLGLALTFALLAAWILAALRPLALRTAWTRLSADQSAERAGLAALAAVVVAFGIQSALDWTWYFAGVAVPALLCAGWLAGRGPLQERVGRSAAWIRLADRPGTGVLVTLLATVALGGAWLMWQPLRSAQAQSAAENAPSDAAALADARRAVSADPLSIQALLLLSQLYQGVHDNGSARAALVQGTRVQPDNPDSWVSLANFDFQIRSFRTAISESHRILALDQASDRDGLTARAIITQAKAQLAARHRGRPSPTHRRSAHHT